MIVSPRAGNCCATLAPGAATDSAAAPVVARKSRLLMVEIMIPPLRPGWTADRRADDR
jgi:hypothetical protein